MCIDFDGHHSGGSSFVYVNDFCYYRNCLYTHKYKFSFEKKKKTSKESQYIASLPGLDSDSPIGSDQESGRDRWHPMRLYMGGHVDPRFVGQRWERVPSLVHI